MNSASNRDGRAPPLILNPRVRHNPLNASAKTHDKPLLGLPQRPPETPTERSSREGSNSQDRTWGELSDEIVSLATPSGAFYLMVVLSTVIAAFGLLANSTAVVIGAMLVAPLMGPIFGISFSLATGDNRLLARSAAAEAKGVLLAIGLAWLIGLVPPHPAFGTEILARTSPTVYDMAIAVASGLAGAFAMADRRVSPALPGVAIATAIVPPLAVTGLCLSALRFDLAFGSLLLFFANLLAIELTGVVYFTIVGIRRGHLYADFRIAAFVQHFAVSLILLLVIGVFMTRTLLTSIAADREEEAIRTTLSDALRTSQGARLTSVSLEPKKGAATEVLATVLTPQEITPNLVAGLEDSLDSRVSSNLRLIVRSIISKDADRNGPVFRAPEDVRRQTETARQTEFLSTASSVMRRSLTSMPGVELTDLRRDGGDSVDVITAVVATPRALTPAQIDSLTPPLEEALGKPIRLVVRSVITVDADRTRFLSDTPDTLAASSSPRRVSTPRSRRR